jgi:hypothetical protein
MPDSSLDPRWIKVVENAKVTLSVGLGELGMNRVAQAARAVSEYRERGIEARRLRKNEKIPH